MADQVVETGVESEINAMLDRLQPIGEAIGDEAVVAVPQTVMREHGMPLFMAELDDAASFSAELEALVAEADAESGSDVGIVIVDDPQTAAATDGQVFCGSKARSLRPPPISRPCRPWPHESTRPRPTPSPAPASTPASPRSTSGGVSWLFGADIAAAVAEQVAKMSPDEAAMMERFGLLDITTLVVERHRDGEWYATNAETPVLRHPQTASWRGWPRPHRWAASSSCRPTPTSPPPRSPAIRRRCSTSCLAILAEKDQDAWAVLQLWQQQIGIDLREDLAATLGGEATFALDGPMLPVPSWKLIVEVYDPATLVHTLGSAIAQLNLVLAIKGEAPVLLDERTTAGRTYYTLNREGLDGLAVFAMIDGYMVAGPSQGVVDQAIAQRASGANLPASDAFRALLPDNDSTDCSALVYRDLESLMSSRAGRPARAVRTCRRRQ